MEETYCCSCYDFLFMHTLYTCSANYVRSIRFFAVTEDTSLADRADQPWVTRQSIIQSHRRLACMGGWLMQEPQEGKSWQVLYYLGIENYSKIWPILPSCTSGNPISCSTHQFVQHAIRGQRNSGGNQQQTTECRTPRRYLIRRRTTRCA